MILYVCEDLGSINSDMFVLEMDIIKQGGLKMYQFHYTYFMEYQ